MKDVLAKEAAKLKNMTIKQKLDYIWSYYKWGILAVAFTLICVISMAQAFLGGNHNAIAVFVCDINYTDSEAGSDILNEAFNNYLGDEADKKDSVIIDASMTLQNNLDDYTAALMSQKLSVMTAGHAVDIIISTQEGFEHCGSLGVYTNLKDFLPEDLFAELEAKDALITATIPADHSGEMPVSEKTFYAGIDLKKLGSSILEDAGYIFEDSMVLGIPHSSQKQERSLKFIQMLLK